MNDLWLFTGDAPVLCFQSPVVTARAEAIMEESRKMSDSYQA